MEKGEQRFGPQTTWYPSSLTKGATCCTAMGPHPAPAIAHLHCLECLEPSGWAGGLVAAHPLDIIPLALMQAGGLQALFIKRSQLISCSSLPGSADSSTSLLN